MDDTCHFGKRPASIPIFYRKSLNMAGKSGKISLSKNGKEGRSMRIRRNIQFGKSSRIRVAFFALIFVSLAETSLAVIAGFQGLGDLEGKIYRSSAYAVSADGSAVVGSSTSNSGSEAFRWTASGGGNARTGRVTWG